MGEKKVTTMVLKVDLQCPCCYKKVKKLLCRYPQIQDQVFDEKANTVKITVVCCSPEKIRDKLCCKGGKTIKSIEIVEPPKPEPPKPKIPEKQPEKVVDHEKPKVPEKPKKPEKAPEPAPKAPEPAPKAPEPAPKPAGPPCAPAPGYPPPQIYPIGVCCGPCYEGIPGGPCYEGYGRPVPCYDYYGCGPYGPYRPCYASRCDYFSEENPTGCTIM